jgi:hypothetical protein
MARIKYIYILILVALSCCRATVLAENQETVYVQTDRSVYISGETVFFKMFVVNSETKKPSERSKVGYLVLRAPKSAPVLKIRVSISQGIATGSFVLPDSLHSDAYQLVAFTAFMKNQGETTFFHRAVVIANRLDKLLNFKTLKQIPADTANVNQTEALLWAKTDKRTYAPGEKVVLRLGSTLPKANLAVSVCEAPPLATPEKTIVETLREVTVPSSEKTMTYMPERQAKILRGRVLDATTNQQIPDAIVLLSCQDSVANLQYAITNSEGLFQLQLTPYYDNKELFISIKEVPTGLHWKIEVDDNFELSTLWQPELNAVQGSTKNYLLKSQDIAYINKTYATKTRDEGKTSSIAPPFCPLLYRRPVKPVRPAEFVFLDSFPEIAVELLPSVRMYRKDGIYHLRTLSRKQQFYGRTDASIFLDGVYLDDIQKIVALNSEKIRKIDVLEDKRAFGGVIFMGIVSIQTTANEILKTVPAPFSLRLKNDSVSVGKNFSPQQPALSVGNRTPYFKQLLYWNPSACLDTDYVFFTSESTGTYRIQTEGLAQNGTPMSTTTYIEVK